MQREAPEMVMTAQLSDLGGQAKGKPRGMSSGFIEK